MSSKTTLFLVSFVSEALSQIQAPLWPLLPPALPIGTSLGGAVPDQLGAEPCAWAGGPHALLDRRRGRGLVWVTG